MATLLERREQLLGSAPLFYEEPVHIVRGEGVWLFDPQGEKYLDMYNNVPCVGHANPAVVEAMQTQMSTLQVHSRYLHEGVLDYAELLLAKHCDRLSKVVFSCSGTEAVEVALMMARMHTGAEGIICTDATYHGNSAEVRKMSRLRGDNSQPNYRAIPYPQTLRPLDDGLSGEALTERYLQEVDRAIDDFRASGTPLAGMIVCSIQANEGLPDIPPGFMARAAEKVRAAGGVFIADEVQAGFCRSGDWWGYETSGFEPDIAVMGKPMGNGMPLSGVAAGDQIVDSFRKGSGYFNTFASSPVQAAVGKAVLEVIDGQGLRESVASTGVYLKKALESRVSRYPFLEEVRGHGLFLALECVEEGTLTPDRSRAARIANLMRQRGVLLGNAGALGNVVKMRPPLVFTREDADYFLDRLDDALSVA